MTNNFDDIIREIYFQLQDVRENNLLPYYLFLSKCTFIVMRDELIKNKELFPEGRLEFFENMEVVPLGEIADPFVEVKGIIIKVC